MSETIPDDGYWVEEVLAVLPAVIVAVGLIILLVGFLHSIITGV